MISQVATNAVSRPKAKRSVDIAAVIVKWRARILDVLGQPALRDELLSPVEIDTRGVCRKVMDTDNSLYSRLDIPHLQISSEGYFTLGGTVRPQICAGAPSGM